MKRAVCLGALAVAGCAMPAADRAGDAEPTIVSLNPCTDAVLSEFVGPDRLLAISHYSQQEGASSMPLERARRYRATGGTVEEIVSLDPDIVVASTFMSPAVRKALSDTGIRVEQFGGIASIAESREQVARLARLAGSPRAGAKLDRELAAVERAVTPDHAIEAALWQPGGIVPGEGALIVELLRAAGFADYGSARGMGQAGYLSLEQVVADPPDVLLVAGTEAAMRHPVLSRIPGMAVAQFDPALLYCGGPTIPAAVRRLRTIRDEVERSGRAEEA